MTADVLAVHLHEVPVPIWMQVQQQTDELRREFALAAAPHEGDHHLPARLTRLMDELTARYGDASSAQERQLFDAAASGETVVHELVFTVPPAVVPACIELGELLDEADDYCRAGEHLLTLAASPEAVAFRRWYLSEFVRQADGRPPVPWPAYDGWWPGSGASETLGAAEVRDP